MILGSHEKVTIVNFSPIWPYFLHAANFLSGNLLWHTGFYGGMNEFNSKSPSILPALTRKCHDMCPFSKKSLHAINGPNWVKIDNFDFFMASQFHFNSKSPSILSALTRKCHDSFPLSKKSLHAKNGPNWAKIDDFDFFMIFPLYFYNKNSPFLPK